MKLPDIHMEILRDRVLIITGCGKSGTTITAAIVASMKPTYHIYEPALLKLIHPEKEYDSELICLSLIYDWLAPIARGVRVCDDPFQLTFSEFQWGTRARERAKRREKKLGGWSVVDYLMTERPLIVINILDGSPRIEQWKKLIPGVKILHVGRNGLDVVHSTASKLWHTNIYYNKPSGFTTDYLKNGMPWYATSETWNEWHPRTRAAHIWRKQMEAKHPDIPYETICKSPDIVTEWIDAHYPFVQVTDLTERWYRRVIFKSRIWAEKCPVTIGDIQKPEDEKFETQMKKLGYL